MDADAVPSPDRRAVRATYRSLRLGLVVVLLLLVTAVVTQAVRTGCWPGSLSASYWSGARDAFVGTLCALGVLLVVHAGVDDVEDALLDLAGLLAFVVALAPTSPTTACDGRAAADAAAGVEVSLTALLVAGVVAWTARAVASARSRPSAPAVAVRAVGWLVLLVLGARLALAPDVLVSGAHEAAAVLMLVAVVGVVERYAFAVRAVAGRWAAVYTVLGAALLLTLAVVVALHAAAPAWQQAVLVLESALVGLFAVFWLLRTVELWDVDVAHRLPPAR